MKAAEARELSDQSNREIEALRQFEVTYSALIDEEISKAAQIGQYQITYLWPSESKAHQIDSLARKYRRRGYEAISKVDDSRFSTTFLW